MQREGVEDNGGKHLAGNRELYQMIERKRRELQENFDFTAKARALRHQFDKIIENENVADLPTMSWDERDRHTNIQHGLCLARQLLSREAGSNKHVILITDGEPTAHIENETVFAKYPPTQQTRLMTLTEIRNCTDDGISVNTFIFKGAEFTEEFINGLAKINRGRIFFTSAQTLGQYVLMDYAAGRSKVMRESQ